MPAKLDIDPSEVTELLMRGFTPPMIAHRLGISDDSVLRIVKKERDDWLPSDNHNTTWQGSRARCALLLMGLGFTQKTVANYMSVSSRTVYRYLREFVPCGQPHILVRLNEAATGEQGERIAPDVYRLLDFDPRIGSCPFS